MLTKAQDASAAYAKAFRGEEAQWKTIHRDANHEWLLDVGRVARQGALLRFYTLNYEGRLAYELREVITYWELNCSTGHAKRLERAKYALDAREVSRERPGSEEVPRGLAQAFASLCP